MSFMIGCLGGLLIVGLFSAGVYAGWRVRGVVEEKRTVVEQPEIPKADAEELRKLKEGQEAFHQLTNYTAEVAYAVGGGEKH